MLESHEIIIPVLDLLKRIATDPRIERRVEVHCFFGDKGGMAPAITVQFSGPFWSEEAIEAEVTVWRGTEAYESIVIIDAFVGQTGDLIIHESVNLHKLSEVEVYFEKILSLYEMVL